MDLGIELALLAISIVCMARAGFELHKRKAKNKQKELARLA